MQFGQIPCMFHISYGLQWRQGLADTCNLTLGVAIDSITALNICPICQQRPLNPLRTTESPSYP